jgi:putative nucleotidyltransferase with HDIG domain/PAS domain S-box-containing protein
MVAQARRETVEAQVVLETLLQQAPVGFAFVDRDFRILRLNESLAATNGLPLAQQLGRTVAETVPDLWPTLGPLFERVRDTGEAQTNVEVTSPTPEDDAAHRDWLTNLYPVRVDGDIIGIGVVVVDVTDRRRLERSQEALTDAVVSALAAAVETRDPYTAGHQRHVAEIAEAIARRLGLDEFTVKGIGLGAAVHDIGKVGVPAEILSKPQRLTDAEYELVKVHADAGFEILRDIEFPWPVAEMVHQHHERLDGSGYPQGLVGEQVCLGARIIAVADVLEAMSAHRPYRPACGVEAALEVLQEGRGRTFDADVVDACAEVVRLEGLYEVAEAPTRAAPVPTG